LRWLKQNNRLYQEFLSNYETIFRHLAQDAPVPIFQAPIHLLKGNLKEFVRADREGMAIPAKNVKFDGLIPENQQQFGIQHPKTDALKKTVSVTYADKDLEAKAWPHLFPTGEGSWFRDSKVTTLDYVKFRLLSMDPRFRLEKQFSFF
jgi:hypothetical protein